MSDAVIKLLAAQVEQLEAELVKRHVELAGFTGKGYKASAGCGTMTVFSGDCEYLIEYEYDPGEPSQTSGPPERCHEGVAENAVITGVLVNGGWFEPSEAGFRDDVIEAWVQKAIDMEIESAEQSNYFERDRYDDARDFAYSQDERAALEGGAYAAVLGAIK